MVDPADERSGLSAEPEQETEELEEDEAGEEEPEEEEARAEEPERKVEKTPPRVRRLDIVGRRNWFFLISLLIIIPGIVSMSTRHFLLGIDFAGGTEFTVSFTNQPTVTKVEDAVSAMNIDGTVISTGSGGYIIRTPPLSPAAQKNVEDGLQNSLGPMQLQQVLEVGGTIARETIEFALLAVVLASLGILLLLAIRFRRFGRRGNRRIHLHGYSRGRRRFAQQRFGFLIVVVRGRGISLHAGHHAHLEGCPRTGQIRRIGARVDQRAHLASNSLTIPAHRLNGQIGSGRRRDCCTAKNRAQSDTDDNPSQPVHFDSPISGHRGNRTAPILRPY